MAQWFYAVKQERQGPVDDAGLAALVANEVVTPETLVWRQGMSEWQPYATVAGAAGAIGTADPEPGAIPPGPIADAELPSPEQSIQLGGQTVTEATKETYVQQLREGIDPRGKGWRYGGFWLRFGAFMIDSVITTVLSYAIIIPLAIAMGGTLTSAFDTTGDESLGIIFLLIFVVIGIAIPATYYTLTTGSTMQATYGKKLVGLRVIREDGGDLSYGQALGRYFGFMLSCIVLYLGLLMVAFDDQKRALHDYICGTRVIER